MLDARKGQVFTAAYRTVKKPMQLLRLDDYQVLEPERAAVWLSERMKLAAAGDVPLIVGGSGLEAHGGLILPSPQGGSPAGSGRSSEGAGYVLEMAPVSAATAYARHVARAGLGEYGAVQPLPYGQIEPFYLRPPDVKPPRLSQAEVRPLPPSGTSLRSPAS